MIAVGKSLFLLVVAVVDVLVMTLAVVVAAAIIILFHDISSWFTVSNVLINIFCL